MAVRIYTICGNILIRNKDCWSFDYPVRFGQYRVQMRPAEYLYNGLDNISVYPDPSMTADGFFRGADSFAKILYAQQIESIRTLSDKFPEFKNKLKNIAESKFFFKEQIILRAAAYGRLQKKNIFGFSHKSTLTEDGNGNVIITNGTWNVSGSSHEKITISADKINAVIPVDDQCVILEHKNVIMADNVVTMLDEMDDSEFFQWASSMNLM